MDSFKPIDLDLPNDEWTVLSVIQLLDAHPVPWRWGQGDETTYHLLEIACIRGSFYVVGSETNGDCYAFPFPTLQEAVKFLEAELEAMESSEEDP